MTKTTFIFIGLIALTMISVLLSIQIGLSHIILVLAAVKFLGISFYFMELKKANFFWKMTLFVLLFSFVGLILLLR